MEHCGGQYLDLRFLDYLILLVVRRSTTKEPKMPKKILVIDDEVLVVESLKRLLKKAGYIVSTAQNYQEAIEGVKKNDFDLIISDIRMAGEDGIEIVKNIRSYLQENKKGMIPEILITGYVSEDKYQVAIELGVRAYLNKPFDIKEFLETVSEILNEK